MRCFERWFRRADVPLGFSEGFHPKPRMTFPAPLAVGIEGLDEVMELELSAPQTAEALRERLLWHSPPGFRLRRLDVLPPGTPKARPRAFCYRVHLPPERCDGMAEGVERLLALASVRVERRGGRAAVDVRPLLDRLELCEGVLSMRLLAPPSGGASPRDLLAALGQPDLLGEGLRVERTAVEVR